MSEIMTDYSNYIFLAIALPFALWAAYSDLKFMKIPNKLVLALTAVFIISAFILLPYTEVLWRLLGGFIVLAIGFILFAIGGIGGGDAKYAAAIALFVPRYDAGYVIFILALAALLAVFSHRMFGKLGFAKSITENWESWHSGKNFPLGLALSGAFLFYLIQRAIIF